MNDDDSYRGNNVPDDLFSDDSDDECFDEECFDDDFYDPFEDKDSYL